MIDSKRYVPDSDKEFDEDFFSSLLMDYRIQKTEVTNSEKIGTCLDVILVMKATRDIGL